MEIKREHGEIDHISISIRLLNVAKKVEELIFENLSDQYEVSLNPKAKGGRLILIKNFDELKDHNKLSEFISNNKSQIENVNFFFGLNTIYDMSGFTVPNNITSLIKEIADTVDFSVINCG